MPLRHVIFIQQVFNLTAVAVEKIVLVVTWSDPVLNITCTWLLLEYNSGQSATGNILFQVTCSKQLFTEVEVNSDGY